MMPRFQTPIEHIVILMMENRSFDHMLGYLSREITDLQGLTGDESCPFDPGDPSRGRVSVHPDQAPDIYVTDPDPGHEFYDVNVQLYGTEVPRAFSSALNNGFVLSYSKVQDKGRPIGLDRATAVMRCFLPEQIPILTTLAKNYIVCDQWYSSVPSSTWPNRFYVHAATSQGDLHTPTNNPMSAVEIIEKFQTYKMPTIYEQLEAQGYTWNIFHGDIPQSWALLDLGLNSRNKWESFRPMSDFYKLAVAGSLPNYSFIEPRHVFNPDNQHPTADVRLGERLIGEVYNAVRSNPDLWKKCLLVVVYDEHGGFYDHQSPPFNVPSPDDINANIGGDAPFRFDRLGVRVPSILISPYVRRGRRVDHNIYDHTAILATTRELFGLPGPLTKRDAWITPLLGENFDFSLSGSDGPPPFSVEQLPKIISPKAFAEASAVQISLLCLAEFINKQYGNERAGAFLHSGESLFGYKEMLT